ncbi:hypothetical protein [Bacillus swezeyi]|uniref:hypothetical protein n=1 Tax=Bacillus swezeyi TaxID=1925020 RepID=UPI0027DE6F23|nr:hypothetical protein [Bacillus swezeyi]
MSGMTQREISRDLFDQVQRLKQEIRQLRKENERYKKALNKIAGDTSVDTLGKAEEIAREALEAAE